MFLLNIYNNKDSIQSFVAQISHEISILDSTVYSIVLSIIVLLLVYIIKYKLIKCYVIGADLLAALMEFPIDVLLIEIPLVIITSFDAQQQRTGVILLLFTMIIMVFSYLFRKTSLDKYNNKGAFGWACILYSFFEVILSVTMASINYYLISRIWIGH